MEKELEFDSYEFENYLTDEFFDGKTELEISDLVENRLASDNDFREQYALWLEKSGYESWKEFYLILQDIEDESLLNVISCFEDEVEETED
jgi:hypothetical protein